MRKELEDLEKTLEKIQREYSHDPEVAHDKADEAIMQFFEDMGEYGIVRTFRLIPKWYA